MPRAQCNLGVCWEFGHGVAKDPAKAADLYRQAAEGGDRVAACNLGYLYETGVGVAQSWADAVTWYRQAVEESEPRAQYNRQRRAPGSEAGERTLSGRSEARVCGRPGGSGPYGERWEQATGRRIPPGLSGRPAGPVNGLT